MSFLGGRSKVKKSSLSCPASFILPFFSLFQLKFIVLPYSSIMLVVSVEEVKI
jgi:hypothetical protein